MIDTQTSSFVYSSVAGMVNSVPELGEPIFHKFDKKRNNNA